MAQINPIFSVPFAFDQLDDCASLNQALRELFIRREAQGPRFANPNPYTPRNKELFESNFDLFSWPEACIAELSEFCLSRIVQTVAELNRYDAARMAHLQIVTDAWFHITRRGGFFGVHNHPMASWSAVYCVSTGEHDADQPDSGRLSFINPMAQMYLDAGNSQLGFPYQLGNYAFDLKPGMLLEGTVTNVTAFGAFVDIGVHQDGLVHISELADTFVKDPHAVIKAGDVVNVRVKEIDADRKRIALSMKREVAGTQGAHAKPAPSQGKEKGGRPAPQNYSAGPPKPSDDSNPFAALKNLKLN